MADFETTLKRLSKGKIRLESLLSKIIELLEQDPKVGDKMLAELDHCYKKKIIDNQQYTEIKRTINEYRRTYLKQGETGQEAGSDATVFGGETPQDKDEEATVFTPNTSDEEATVLTQSSPDEEATVLSQNSTGTSAIDTTGSAGTDFGEILDITGATSAEGMLQDQNLEFKGGAVIKQRFRLEKVLGIGGMGKVYKALDLLKDEAKDKKPYVAVKLLNEDFKHHQESFIALQREASRQQKLAHPNIATIYDFDRVGGAGTPVFITMELMEGMEIKDFIKKTVKPKKGLPFQEAYNVIKQMGAGLIYAHDRRLVHSDFKPGNTFLCNDGIVKILDFGIARAVKNPVTGEAEKTLFDAGQLGALTPAYASLEMLSGEEPDTRDDTYALGCTAYELLTGDHPFKKKPANKAQAANMEPPYIKKLNRKQNRALRRSIAFYRKDRSPSVEHFLEELEGKITIHKNPFFIAACVLIIAGLIIINPVDKYHEYTLNQIVEAVKTGTENTIFAKLDEIKQLDPTDKTTVAEQTKDTLQNYFKDKIAVSIDTSTNNYDFPKAHLSLKEIEGLYPESIFLQEQTDLINETKKQFISALNTDYVSALRDSSQIGNIKKILEHIARVDSSHPLLEDPRPSVAYRELARNAFENRDYDEALELVKSGLETAPEDPRLLDLEAGISKAKTIDELEQSIANNIEQLNTLENLKPQEAQIKQLSGLKFNSTELRQLAEKIQPVVTDQVKKAIQSKDQDAINQIISNYSVLFRALSFHDQLTRLKLANLSGNDRNLATQSIAQKDIEAIEQKLASPNVQDTAWEAELLANFQELKTLTKEDAKTGEILTSISNKIATLYVEEVNILLEQNRFDTADSILQRGELFVKEAPEIVETRSIIADAREEDARQERIRSSKSDLKTFAEASNITQVIETYQTLEKDRNNEDIAFGLYMDNEASRIVSDTYVSLAQSRAETKDFKSAFVLAQDGLKIDPGNSILKKLKNDYEAEVNITNLLKIFSDNSVTLLPDNVRIKIDQIQNYADSARVAEFNKEAIELLAKKINQVRTTNETAAASLALVAATTFPASSILAQLKSELELKPWPKYNEANIAISAGKLSQAQQLQEVANVEYAGHPQFISFSNILEGKLNEANSVFDIYTKDKEAAGEDYTQLRSVKNLLTRAQQLWVDNEKFKEEEESLDALIAKYKPKPKPKIRAAETFLSAGGGELGLQKEIWEPIDSDAECIIKLAGHGRRAKAICFDMIHKKARGPAMVVVPASDENTRPFAIGKYEISVGDWSKYCIISKRCEKIADKNKNDPITGITLKEAQNYAKWLSERTGKVYRLPTKEEWEYAAMSGGKQPKKDFNCRVALDDKIIKGTGTISVKSGRSNKWGLKNYIGNVQEWVFDGDNATARGGAYTDPHSKCDISLQREHNGQADQTTGFRLLRENIG